MCTCKIFTSIKMFFLNVLSTKVDLLMEGLMFFWNSINQGLKTLTIKEKLYKSTNNALLKTLSILLQKLLI